MDSSLWTGRPRPLEDELLSSWLIRIAAMNGVKLHTFSQQMWPHQSIWNRDIDGFAPETVLRVASDCTGVPLERVRETTLGAFSGAVFEHHQPRGLTPWILPLGIYHRTRLRHGNQCCPRCLAESPYYRRTWRLAFATICVVHRVPLLDRCPECGEAIAFHRREIGDRSAFDASLLVGCHACGRNFRKETPRRIAANARIVGFQSRLEAVALTGAADVGGVSVFGNLFFSGLRILVRLCASPRYGESLQAELSRRAGIASFRPDWVNGNWVFENLGVDDRRGLLTFASVLLEDWPHRFLEVARRVGIRGSDVGGHDRWVPYWIASVVDRELNGKRHVPSVAEITSVIDHLRKSGEEPTRESVGRYIGVEWFRKRSLSYLLEPMSR